MEKQINKILNSFDYYRDYNFKDALVYSLCETVDDDIRIIAPKLNVFITEEYLKDILKLQKKHQDMKGVFVDILEVQHDKFRAELKRFLEKYNYAPFNGFLSFPRPSNVRKTV